MTGAQEARHVHAMSRVKGANRIISFFPEMYMQLFLHAMQQRSHALLPTSMPICTAIVVTDARK
jgi:hypothetical protein